MTFKENMNIIFVILVTQWLTESLHKTEAIISRDLILTPKQELQLRGKSIYYREQTPHLNALASNATQLTTPRTWERTLKHVTYVTLFANAAAVTNMSNAPLSDYDDFLKAPYVIAGRQRYEAPFGDIVTLASGRLELLTDNSFRFVEGIGGVSSLDCGYVPACETTRVLAMWQVQKVRHREFNSATLNGFGSKRNYRYEIKFNVTPLKRNDNANFDATESTEIWHANARKMQKQQTYIQKEEDYPQSFARIIYNNQRDNAFAERRRDAMANVHDVKPMAQSTFIHNIFKSPSTPPLFTSLNTGEYLKDNNYAAQQTHILPPLNIKATPKIELFPNVYNTPNFLKPTTFRPNYLIKLAKPELPALPTHYQPNTVANGGGGITHHFHHHFYMPTSTTVGGGSSGGGGSGVHEHYQRPIVTALETPAKSYYKPTPHANEHHAPILYQIPNIYGQASSNNNDNTIGHTTRIPLLIYAAPEHNTETSHVVEAHEKPFQQSEPLDEEIFRYSEPDPLYTAAHSQDNVNVQLEAPEEYATHGKQDDQHTENNSTELTTRRQQIDVQLNVLDVPTTIETSVPAVLEQYHDGSQKRNSYVQDNNHNSVFVSKNAKQNLTTEGMATTFLVAASPVTTTEALASTTTTTINPTTATSRSVNQHRFVPSLRKTNVTTNLRALSRYNNNNGLSSLAKLASQKRNTTIATTTSTEQSMFKWNPQRRRDTSNAHINGTHNSSTLYDNVDKDSKIYEATTVSPNVTSKLEISDERIIEALPVLVNQMNQTVVLAAQPTEQSMINAQANIDDDFYEILTQKSVSKSVSIKVGDNGEEIPIIVDDEVNEVKFNQSKTKHTNSKD